MQDDSLNDLLRGLGTHFAQRDRIARRAKRAAELTLWGLHPQNPDAGSSLALDDTGFMPEHAPLVTEMALWPIMAATDTLTTMSELALKMTQRIGKAEVRSPTLMTLARSAAESSARSIWLLSDTDRDIRRRRAIGLLVNELGHQTNYTGNEVASLRGGLYPQATAEQIAAYEKGNSDLNREYQQRKADTKTYDPPAGFSKTTVRAATWIDAHIPLHDEGELAPGTMGANTKRFYQLSSGIGHGMVWSANTLRSIEFVFGAIADSLATAVNMTECAIALFEAQAQRLSGTTDRERFYPERLEQTIKEWRRLY